MPCINFRRMSLHRPARSAVAFATAFALAAPLTAPVTAIAIQPETLPESTRAYLYFESFDGVRNPAKFTHRLPDGWEQNVTGVTSGEARWNGWTLTDMRNWVWASGTEERHYFTQGHDQMAIIDSKQQALAPRDSMNATLTSPILDVTGHERVALEFDHHYRQGRAGQSARVSVSFDGAEPQTVATFSQNRYTQHEYYEIDVPAGASEMRVEFAYLGGNNDYWWAIDNVAVREPFTQPADSPVTIIDVISDTQDDPDDYKLAIRHLNAMPDKAQALVINGDLVDTGRQEQWDKFMRARSEVTHDSGVELWTIGNHELYGQELDFQVKMDRYFKYAGEVTGQTEPWQEIVVNGTPLIGISTEYYQDSDRDGKEPFQRISAEQLAWLDERLAHWDAEGVTALVFTHPLLPETVSMSHSRSYQNDFEDLTALSDVLSKYNDLVLFTSHSHASLRQPNWWGTRLYDGTPQGSIGFPVFNTGAILNEYMPLGDHAERITDSRAATGLRVKIYDDRVRVEAWDFKSGHGLTNLNPGKPEMIKYQDISKQRRLSDPTPTPTPTETTTVTQTTTREVPTTLPSTVTTAVPTTVETTVEKTLETTVEKTVEIPTTVEATVTATVPTPVPTTVNSVIPTVISTTVTNTVTAPVPTTVISEVSTTVATEIPTTVTETATETVTQTTTRTEPQPAPASSGSSTGGVIALLLGLLALVAGALVYFTPQIEQLLATLPGF